MRQLQITHRDPRTDGCFDRSTKDDCDALRRFVASGNATVGRSDSEINVSESGLEEIPTTLDAGSIPTGLAIGRCPSDPRFSSKTQVVRDELPRGGGGGGSVDRSAMRAGNTDIPLGDCCRLVASVSPVSLCLSESAETETPLSAVADDTVVPSRVL